MERCKRALNVCGVLAAILWSGLALADDPVERASSLIAEARYAEARAELESLTERDANMPRVRLIHGILLVREGKAAEAIAVFESLRGDHPDMFEPHNNVAVLYAGQGRLDAARDALIAALERRPDAAAYSNLGDVYLRLADRAYARAREVGANEGASARRGGKGDAISAGPVEPAGPPAVQATESRSRRSDAEPAVSESAAVSKPVSAVPQPTATRAKAAAKKPEDDLQSPVAEPRQAENAAAPESVPAAESGDLCVQAGMFDNREAAAKAAEWIRTLGAESAEIRHRERRFVKHYRVFLPAFPSREAAVAKVRELRGRGIRDVAIMSKGARANEIALGLYKVEGNMRRRVAALKKLGYPAMSEPNMKTRSEYAVEARDGDALSALDRDFSSRFPGHPIRYVPCEDSG